jgi:hypothetical protein
VGRIIIDAPRSLDSAAALREGLRAGVERKLGEDGSVTYDARDRDASHVLNLRIVEGLPDPGADQGPFVLLVRLKPLGDGALYEVPARVGPGDPAKVLLTTFDEAWRVVRRERELDAAKDPALITALTDDDPRIRDFVTVRLGDRKSRAAVPALCDRLVKEPRPELVLRAVGALVAIKDPRAVEPIIDLGKRREAEFVLQTVFAIGAIGGRVAEAYLVTIASGHPSEAVRRGAEQALTEMQRSAASNAGKR